MKLNKVLSIVLSTAMVTSLMGGMSPIKTEAATELVRPENIVSDYDNGEIGYHWVSNQGWNVEDINGRDYKYEPWGIKGDGSRYRVTGGMGVDTFIVMPTPGHENDPSKSFIKENIFWHIINPAEDRGNYYLARLGERKPELTNGNSITGENEKEDLGDPFEFDENFDGNGRVETTKFGSGSNTRTLETQVITSIEGRYMIADYYIYGREDIPEEGQKLYLALPIMLLEDFGKNTVSSKRGMSVMHYEYFHDWDNLMLEKSDIILYDPSLGIDAKLNSKWMGNNNFENLLTSGYLSFVIDKETPGHIQAHGVEVKVDTPEEIDGIMARDTSEGLSFSWEINIHPYEIVHRRIAYTFNEAAVYVSATRGSDYYNVGYYDKPVRSIERAIKIANGKNAIIYIQDYDKLNHTIEFPENLSPNTSITFASADLDKEGKAHIYGGGAEAESPVVMKRDPEFDGAFFKNNQNIKINFENITLDGEGRGNEALIVSSAGRVNINNGTSLINSAAGALDITGGNLNLKGRSEEPVNPVKITGNNGNSDTKGAVKITGNGEISVSGMVNISGNTRQTTNGSENANVYLGEGKTVKVNDQIAGSTIGVVTEKEPEDGSPVVIAEPSDTNPAGAVAPTPFLDKFTKDSSVAGLGIDMDNTQTKAVLKASTQKIKFIIKDNKGNAIAGAPTMAEMKKPVGEMLTLPAPPQYFVAGGATYTLETDKCESYPAYPTSPFLEDGSFRGVMPNEDLQINYIYTPNVGAVVFNGNGGIPALTPAQKGNVGEAIAAPLTTRYGYTLTGWNKSPDGTGEALEKISGVYSAIINAGVRDTYYAQWIPDTAATFTLRAEYTNEDHSIVFAALDSPGIGFSTPFTTRKKNIPGYVWSRQASDKIPSSLEGDFDSLGEYSGVMPLQDASVRYGYSVSTDPADKFPFKVYYRLGSLTGPLLKVSDHTGGNLRYFAEENISYTPTDFMGYDISDAKVVEGITSSTEGDTDNFVTGIKDYSFDENNKFRGKMPNQAVTLVYVLTPNGSALPYSVVYKDGDTTDPLLENIIPVKHERMAVGTSIIESFKNFYGYNLSQSKADPTDAGSFNTLTHDYEGVMPAGELQIEYKYSRDMSKWADIKYIAGAKGSLNIQRDPEKSSYISSDVVRDGEGYKTSILIDDGSDEGKFAYTLKEISDKHLMPKAVADKYYLFEGWFEDVNGDGIRNMGESLIENNHRFGGSVTLTASFVEDPEWWGDIYFRAGENGYINEGEPVIKHLTKDTKWWEVIPPSTTPVVNYLKDKWYEGSIAMRGDSNISLGATYTFRFIPDPAVFGNNPGVKDVEGGINTENGKGKLTVYDSAQGYSYIVTETDGKVIDIQEGNATGRNIFEGLYPEHIYHVYEVVSPVNISPGENISALGTGEYSEVLIPAVENNYNIDFDEENDAYTSLIISPADTLSEYALIDEEGKAVINSETRDSGWQRPKAGVCEFKGLTYDAKYTVVARPTGSSLSVEERKAFGTQLVMDPGDLFEIPKFIVEAKGGSVERIADNAVNAERFDEVHAGEKVELSAKEADFMYWKVLAGAIPGISGEIKDRNFTFIMPPSNVVLAAYYNEQASPSNAKVSYETKGSLEGEIGLNPEIRGELSNLLTRPEDVILNQINYADVKYKVIYKKGKPSALENELIKAQNPFNLHESAYTGAWSVNTYIERYVNGRKVDRDMDYASGANLETYIQLNNKDVDMMDYRLYEVSKDELGNPVLSEIAMSEDPENTGGLFKFTANPGKRYVLAYSKAFKLTFKYSYENMAKRFKVRKGEMPVEYEEFKKLPTPIDEYFDTDTGYKYTYLGWSRSSDTFKAFDENKKMTRRTTLYSYYKSNKEEVDLSRKKLEEALRKAIELSDSYFLKKKESAKLNEFIKEVAKVLDGKPSLEELNETLDKFLKDIKPYEEVLDIRYEDYNNGTVTREDKNHNVTRSTARSGGGTGGGGSGTRSGSGTKAQPFVLNDVSNYHVGVDGNWFKRPDGKWQFKYNGGIPVVSMWAWLVYDNGNSTGWYHFNDMAIMDEGWIKDEKGNWYYLDPVMGVMVTGWKLIEGKWYYFNQNAATLPVGALYTSTTTPDGYRVDASGALN